MTIPGETLTGAVERIAAKVGGKAPDQYPSDAHAPGEELLVCYSKGTGRFSEGNKLLSMSGTIYGLDGREIGHWEGIYEIVVPVSQWGVAPPRPLPPFDVAGPPVEHIPPAAFSKARWEFDGSSITAIGPATLYRTEYLQGWGSKAVQFWLSADQQITHEATGRFANARGVKTQSVSIYVPPGEAFPGDRELIVKTTEAFRITLGQEIG